MTDIGGDLSQATTDTTKSPGAVLANHVYDIFVLGATRAQFAPRADQTGLQVLDLSLFAERAQGSTALTFVQGFYVNTFAIANGPAAGLGTYVGTIASNASSTIDMVFGSLAAGGGTASLNVWNAYNQVFVQAKVQDSTANWSYSGGFRSANGSAGNRVNFVCGLQQNAITAAYTGRFNMVNAALANVAIGFALDNPAGADYQQPFYSSSGLSGGASVVGPYAPLLGSHFIQATEKGDGTNANQFVGSGLSNLFATMVM